MENVVKSVKRSKRDYSRLPQSKALAIQLRAERASNERLGFRGGSR